MIERAYPHQAELIAASIECGEQCALLHSATGSGKTVVAMFLTREYLAKNKRVLFLAPRRSLVQQAAQTFEDNGIEVALLMSGEQEELNQQLSSMVRCYVASRDTLRAWVRRGKMALPNVDLVIVDEAHLLSDSALWQLEEFKAQGARIRGLTATPAHKQGLDRLYREIISTRSVRSLTKDGFLSPLIYYGPACPDLGEVRSSGGEYHKGDLEKVYSRATIIGDTVSVVLKYVAARPTVIFCSGVAHASAVATKLRNAGLAAEYIEGKMPGDVQAAIMSRYDSGQTQIVCNADLLTFGVDKPQTSGIVLARATKSVTLLLQMLGRGMRTHPGKTDCVVVDQGSNIARLGFADDDFVWSLEGEPKVFSKATKRLEKPEKTERTMTCPDCESIHEPASECPECGHFYPRRGRGVEIIDGEIVPIRAAAATVGQARLFYRQLLGHCQIVGWDNKRAAGLFKDKYGKFPRWEWSRLPPVEPGPEVRGYIRHCQIKWAKRRKVA